MRLPLLAAFSCLLALSGCISADDDAQPLTDADGAVAPAPAETTPAAVADVNIQKTYDLSQGLPKTNWDFQVAPGATGHVVFRIHDLVTKEAVVSGSACIHYEVESANLYSKGSRGTCGGGVVIGVSGTTSDSAQTILYWDDLGAGDYHIDATADVQLNELVVDIVVDNP